MVMVCSLDKNLVCYGCNRNYTNFSCGSIRWHPNHMNDNTTLHLCHSCFNHILHNGRRKNHQKYLDFNKKHNPRRQWYKDRYVMIDKPPRIGVCNLCRAVRNEINAQVNRKCKKTHLHHEYYHDENTLKDTIEICEYCHGVITRPQQIIGPCSRCGSKSTYMDRYGKPRWKRGPNGESLCKRCKDKIYHSQTR